MITRYTTVLRDAGDPGGALRGAPGDAALPHPRAAAGGTPRAPRPAPVPADRSGGKRHRRRPSGPRPRRAGGARASRSCGPPSRTRQPSCLNDCTAPPLPSPSSSRAFGVGGDHVPVLDAACPPRLRGEQPRPSPPRSAGHTGAADRADGRACRGLRLRGRGAYLTGSTQATATTNWLAHQAARDISRPCCVPWEQPAPPPWPTSCRPRCGPPRGRSARGRARGAGGHRLSRPGCAE